MKIEIELGPNLAQVALKAMSNPDVRPSFALREALNLDMVKIVEKIVDWDETKEEATTIGTVTIERE